jgi:7-cyano-7-deazaguanine synthase
VKAVLIYSGGLDSTTLLYLYRALGHEVQALGIDYGQRHAVELQHALLLARDLGVPYRVADLRGISDLFAGSSQTSPDVPVPEGHYAEESMKVTVVPNRNMVMLSLATALAVSLRYDAVAYAAHSGDHAIYPDCRKDFTDALRRAILLADWHPVNLETPFIGKSKAEIVAIGSKLGVPFEKTWSCYRGGRLHCSRCGTCVERREAFALAGVHDPTEYEVRP